MRALLVGCVLVAVLGPACSGISKREADPIDIERVPKSTPLPPPAITRAALTDVLSRSPGSFLQRMPVRPALQGGRFLGFEVLALYGNAPPHPDGVHVGDIVTEVNGVRIVRPAHLMKLWRGLRRADQVDVSVIRRGNPVRVTYRIIDQ